MRLGSTEWRDTLKKELTTFTPEQIQKAIGLVKSAKYVGEHMGDYVFVSSDGDQVYLTSAWKQSCTCAAGHYGMKCYHLCAADALAAFGQDQAKDALRTEG